MAKFIFRLENILSLKEKLEEQAKNEYSQKMAALRVEEEQRDALILHLGELEKTLKESMEGILSLASIRQTELAMDGCKEQIKQQQLRVEQAEQQVRLARHHLNEAMKERKIYERLKEKEFDKFLKELNQQEMKEIDELVSYNYGKKEENEE